MTYNSTQPRTSPRGTGSEPTGLQPLSTARGSSPSFGFRVSGFSFWVLGFGFGVQGVGIGSEA